MGTLNEDMEANPELKESVLRHPSAQSWKPSTILPNDDRSRVYEMPVKDFYGNNTDVSEPYRDGQPLNGDHPYQEWYDKNDSPQALGEVHRNDPIDNLDWERWAKDANAARQDAYAPTGFPLDDVTDMQQSDGTTPFEFPEGPIAKAARQPDGHDWDNTQRGGVVPDAETPGWARAAKEAESRGGSPLNNSAIMQGQWGGKDAPPLTPAPKIASKATAVNHMRRGRT